MGKQLGFVYLARPRPRGARVLFRRHWFCWRGPGRAARFLAAALLASSAAAAAEDASPPPSLEEVVVTAERRTTNLQTTGISASVLSGADLANKGIMTVDGLQAIAPSVVIENFGQGNNFNIRGIGKGEHNTQTSTGVITYRDGVPTFPGYFQDDPYYDISNLEI